MRYSQRLGSVVLVTTVSFPHSRRTWDGQVRAQVGLVPQHPPPTTPGPPALTVVERLGPCQQPVPCSYFMALNLSWSGPAHEPQVLWESRGGEVGALARAGMLGEGIHSTPSPHSPKAGGGAAELGFLRDELEGTEPVDIPVTGQGWWAGTQDPNLLHAPTPTAQGHLKLRPLPSALEPTPSPFLAQAGAGPLSTRPAGQLGAHSLVVSS